MEPQLLEALVGIGGVAIGAALTAWKLTARNRQKTIDSVTARTDSLIQQIDQVRQEQIEYLTRFAGVIERANEHMSVNARHHNELLNATAEIKERLIRLDASLGHDG